MNVASNSGREFPRRRRQALERLLEMTTLLGEGMETDTAGRGLTVARAEVVWLVHHRGPMRQRDLADALRVSPRNVTGLLDVLESTGFVALTPTSDRRATLIQLTEKGAAAAGALATDQAEFARYLFGDLSQAELDRFLATAGKLLGRLRDRSYADLRQAALKRWAAQDPATATALRPRAMTSAQPGRRPDQGVVRPRAGGNRTVLGTAPGSDAGQSQEAHVRLVVGRRVARWAGYWQRPHRARQEGWLMDQRPASAETLAAQGLGEADPVSGALAPVINLSTNYEQQPDGT